MKYISDEEMDKMTDDQLQKEIKKSDISYFKLDSPYLEDERYDRLKIKLAERQPTNNLLFQVGSPESKGTYKHEKAMLSLDKGYTEDDIKNWAKKINGDVGGCLKLDGLALSLIYEDRKLVRAVTRGDGEYGEDVTDAVREVNSIPQTIPVSRKATIRGEAYLPFSKFDWIVKNTDGNLKNPRNAASGAIKTKKVTGDRTDFSDTTKKILSLVVFEAYDVLNPTIDNYQDLIKTLSKAGFSTPTPFVMGLDEAFKLWNELNINREKYDKPIDGLVLRANSYKEYEEQGYTGHHPRGAMAYKFSAEIKETTLKSVEWSVGRTGNITPVGIVEPTSFAANGVTVDRVSLHNLNVIKTLDLTIGCRIQLKRSGDVIPCVVGLVSAGQTPIEIPTTCPACSAPTKTKSDFLVCSGENCTGGAIRGIEHYCKSVGIDGFGPAIIEKLYEAELISHFSHLYTKLSVDNMTPVLGEKTAKNLMKQIDSMKTIPLAKFLDGLGINHLGTTMGKKLESIVDAKSPKDLVDLSSILEKNGDQVNGLGDVVKNNVVKAMPKLVDFLNELDGIITLTKEKQSGTLTGKSFVFTGSMKKYKRPEAQSKVAALGGDTPSGVKKGLTYLVVGEEDGPKSDKQIKAEKLGITVLSESEFIKIIGE